MGGRLKGLHALYEIGNSPVLVWSRRIRRFLSKFIAPGKQRENLGDRGQGGQAIASLQRDKKKIACSGKGARVSTLRRGGETPSRPLEAVAFYFMKKKG